jgi:CRISPR-associated protein Cas1
MESLFIDRRGVSLDVEGQVLLVRHPDERKPASFPLQNVERVVIASKAQLSSSVIQACTRAGVSLLLLNPRAIDLCAVTMPWRHGNAARRVAQYRLNGTAEFCLDASRALVRSKLLSQIRTLRRMLRHYPGSVSSLRVRRNALATRYLVRFKQQTSQRCVVSKVLPHAAIFWLCPVVRLQG